MQTSPVTAETLSRTVVSVPPLARHADLALNRAANVQMIRHLESGGVSALLYGGNANLYHQPISQLAELLSFLQETAADDTLIIPSVGPSYGAMIDQAAIVRDFEFPTAMVLPQSGICTSAGVATGVRRFVEAYGKPAILYIKQDGYVEVPDARRLMDEGLISVIKYACVREETADDEYLRRLVDVVDPKRIMSGIGEQPAIVHLRDFGLGGFTSGCICVAPKLSIDMLRAIQAEDFAKAETIRRIFQPLEKLRNTLNPIRVLHEAVTLAGIGDMGPMLPLLSNLAAGHHSEVQRAATDLLAQST